MKTIYRKLTPSESGEYRKIRLESLRDAPNNFGSAYEIESKKNKLAFEQFIEEQAEAKFIIGAFEDAKLVGICGFSRESPPKQMHWGYIIQMYVKPQYRGKKIGKGLLDKTMEEAFKIPGIEQLILGVITTNHSAITVYEKAGFTEYGLLKNCFKAGDKYLDERFMVYRKPA